MRTRTLWIIVIAAAVVRLVLLADAWEKPIRCFTPDTEGYIKLSHSLIESGRFAMDSSPEIFRTPGYPLFMAVGAPFGESWWRAVIIVQIILDAALVYLTFLLAFCLAGQRAGLLAAALQAVSPLAMAYSVRILSDSLFAFMLTLVLLLLVFHFKTAKTWPAVAAACFLGAACYVRPVGQVIAIVCFLALLIGRRKIAPAAAFIGIIVLAVAPWFARNVAVAQCWGFSSFAGDSLYFFYAPEVIAAEENINSAEARARMKEADYRENADKPPGLAARDRARRAWQIIVENPGLYAKIHLRGSLGFFLPGATDLLEVAGLTAGNAGTLDVLHKYGLVAAVRNYFGGNWSALILAAPLAAILAIKYAATVFLFIKGMRRRIQAEVWMLIAVAVVLVLLTGPFGLPRYRLSVEPLLCVAAGAGFAQLMKRGGKKSQLSPQS